MKRANALLFSLLMIVSSLAGCLGGEEFDSTDIEEKISDLETNQTALQQANQDLQSEIESLNEELNASKASLEEISSNLNDELNASRESLEELSLTHNQTVESLLEKIRMSNKVNFAFLDMKDSEFYGSDFSYSNMTSSQFGYSTFQVVNFSFSDLSNALFNFSEFDRVDFTNAKFNNNSFDYATFIESKFYGHVNNTSFGHSDHYKTNFSNTELSNVDFTGSTFSTNVDFTGSILENVDLSNINLRMADFSKSTFVRVGGIGVDCPLLLPQDWTCMGNVLLGPNAILSYATLDNLNLSGVDLSDAILDGVRGVNLEQCPSALPSEWYCINKNLVGPGANLQSANLTGMDLSNLNLSGVELTNTNLEHSNLSGTDLTDCVSYSGLLLFGADLSDTNFSNCYIQSSNLEAVDFKNADLSYAYMNIVDLTNAKLSDANLFRLTARNVDCPLNLPGNWRCLSGLLFGPSVQINSHTFSSQVDWRYVNLSNSIIEYGSFTSTNFGGSVFDGANFTLSYFQHASLVGTTFINAELNGVRFDSANLTYSDFSGALIDSVNFLNANLTGATFSGTTWINTTCPDGTNSDDNGDTCENNL